MAKAAENHPTLTKHKMSACAQASKQVLVHFLAKNGELV
jgi:hypothetical protein